MYNQNKAKNDKYILIKKTYICNHYFLTGTVLDCVKGVDGGVGAVYEVQYKGEEEPYEIDHLQEDLDNGSLKFKDL